MARKRMFDSEVINTEEFLDLPISTKAVYFLLGMEADDEGFVNPKRVLRLYGGTEDDIKLLIMKNFVILFESGVIVITDWKRNNYIDVNKWKKTIYVNEKQQIIYNENTKKYEYKDKSLTKVKLKLNQNRIEENRIEENRIEENRIDNSTVTTNARDLNKQDIFSYLEQAWGRILSPYEYELISKWENDEITKYAIKESVKGNARSIRYVERIVSDLKAKGIKTEAEAIKESDNFKQKQNELKSGRGTSKSKLDEEREKIRKWAEQND